MDRALCPQHVFWPGTWEGHTAQQHPGVEAEFEVLAAYPQQRFRVVYRRSGGSDHGC